nr:hypothetical protein [Thermoanaerobaculia bacterium]
MKKTVLKYGLISGVIAAGLMLAQVPFMDGSSRALIVGYAGIVLATVVTSSRQLGGRLIAEAESLRQKRVVDMLLDDFQENARDCLWEIDEDG